jgi:hypothetical protein
MGILDRAVMAGRVLLRAELARPVGVARGAERSYIWMVTFVLAGGPGEDVFVGRAAELAGLADVLARYGAASRGWSRSRASRGSARRRWPGGGWPPQPG